MYRNQSQEKLKSLKPTILKNAKIRERLSTNPQEGIKISSFNVEVGKKTTQYPEIRKSFGQFLDSNSEKLFHSVKAMKKRNLKSLIVSFDNKIKPIHLKGQKPEKSKHLSFTRTETHFQKEQSYKPVIHKAERHSKQFQIPRRFSEWSRELAEYQSIKFVKKPLVPKQCRFYTQINEIKPFKFDCRPWSRRGQRELPQQTQDQIIEPEEQINFRQL